MRTRRRIALLLAAAGALGVGLIAFPTSAAAVPPPVVPACSFPNTSGNDSCVRGRIQAANPPLGRQFENIRLGVRTRTRYDLPGNCGGGGCAEIVTVRFDDDGQLNYGGIPTCAPSEVAGDTIGQAWEQCGPGADGNPPSSGNAYLSTPNALSGRASTAPPANLTACTMVFRGPNVNVPGPPDPNPTVTLFARAPVNPQTGCNQTAGNDAGQTTVILRGFLTREAASSPFLWRLRVPNIDASPLPLDDFYATVARGTAHRARCPANNVLRLGGIFDYSGSGQATDPASHSQSC
jgi:hypothetical protein